MTLCLRVQGKVYFFLDLIAVALGSKTLLAPPVVVQAGVTFFMLLEQNLMKFWWVKVIEGFVIYS